MLMWGFIEYKIISKSSGTIVVYCVVGEWSSITLGAMNAQDHYNHILVPTQRYNEWLDNSKSFFYFWQMAQVTQSFDNWI